MGDQNDPEADASEDVQVDVGHETEADAGADVGEEASMDTPSHAEAAPEADQDEPAMETDGDEGCVGAPQDAPDETTDQSLGDAYPPPGSETSDGIGISADGMGAFVGVGT